MLNRDWDHCLLDSSIGNLIIIPVPFYSVTNMHSSPNSGNLLFITAYINQVILSNNARSKSMKSITKTRLKSIVSGQKLVYLVQYMDILTLK